MNYLTVWKRYQDKMKENVLLWSITIILIVISLYTESYFEAAKRPFSITDAKISYPFTLYERYDDFKLLSVCVVLPLILTTMIIMVDYNTFNQKFQKFYKTTSCFSFAIAITVFITTFLKIRLAKLRPDFLSRCSPNIELDEINQNIIYTEEICTAPFGEKILNDGYKSCPSGHSAVSTCGMLFLSLWIYKHYGKNNKNGIIPILCFAPLLITIDVVTSRIYDFRHDYYDIISGTVIGALGTLISIKYIELEEGKDDEMEIILPI